MYRFVIASLGIAFGGFMAFMLTKVEAGLPSGMKPIVYGAVAGFVLIIIIWAMSDGNNSQPERQDI